MPYKEYRFNPVHYGMEMMAQAQNQSMLFVTTNGYRLHGFASRPVAGGKGGGKGGGQGRSLAELAGEVGGGGGSRGSSGPRFRD